METRKTNRLPDAEPAASIIREFGGTRIVREITGVHRSRVHKWRRPRDVNGTGGVIPLEHIGKLLDYAKQNGIRVTAEDFIPRAE
jgi:hypothetical protein